jgi:hypothetical protein
VAGLQLFTQCSCHGGVDVNYTADLYYESTQATLMTTCIVDVGNTTKTLRDPNVTMCSEKMQNRFVAKRN